jgi:hypothetical protein
MEFDGFQPDMMVEECTNKFIVWRMVPPGKHRYFFSIGTQKVTYSYDQPYDKDKSQSSVVCLFDI